MIFKAFDTILGTGVGLNSRTNTRLCELTKFLDICVVSYEVCAFRRLLGEVCQEFRRRDGVSQSLSLIHEFVNFIECIEEIDD